MSTQTEQPKGMKAKPTASANQQTKNKLQAVRAAKTMEKMATLLLRETRTVQKRAIAALNILFAD